ncbi:hypothetical protein V6x_55450 [Gimesia chilikensis]|uniref:Uncharacterized protein n=1 Tax=Gimesia chilikensis TaxID=2605989 RepID=A0A517WKL8_9PLAN|nr:hypothetical protein [Gimesia chilikensis]QDU05803.1 hypothetical protein V6x_55450 [Gimesia chilikensis]
MKNSVQQFLPLVSLICFVLGQLTSIWGGPWWGYLLPLPVGLGIFIFIGWILTSGQQTLVGCIACLMLAGSLTRLFDLGFNSLWFNESAFALFTSLGTLFLVLSVPITAPVTT